MFCQYYEINFKNYPSFPLVVLLSVNSVFFLKLAHYEQDLVMLGNLKIVRPEPLLIEKQTVARAIDCTSVGCIV